MLLGTNCFDGLTLLWNFQSIPFFGRFQSNAFQFPIFLRYIQYHLISSNTILFQYFTDSSISVSWFWTISGWKAVNFDYFWMCVCYFLWLLIIRAQSCGALGVSTRRASQNRKTSWTFLISKTIYDSRDAKPWTLARFNNWGTLKFEIPLGEKY